MPTAIPIYLFCGFLESGKTTFLQESLEDKNFYEGERTLLILCEDGEKEYDAARFAGAVDLAVIETESGITLESLLALQKQYRPDRVLIEYNGMWKQSTLYDALPDHWRLYQIVTLADSTTFPAYLQNMRQQAVDKLQDAETVVFNRCTDATDKVLLHRSVRMVNRRAMILFERTDGSLDEDTIQDELPFDKSADVIEIADADFALWYLDAFDHLDEYVGKTVQFKAYVCQSERAPKECFVAGRFAMTCCADDIAYLGFLCEAEHPADYAHRSWVTVTAVVSKRRHEIYEGEGPWLTARSVTPSHPPEEELVYFLR